MLFWILIIAMILFGSYWIIQQRNDVIRQLQFERDINKWNLPKSILDENPDRSKEFAPLIGTDANESRKRYEASFQSDPDQTLFNDDTIRF